MVLIICALILGLAIFLSAAGHSATQKTFHVKPRIAFAQATITGRTEDSETLQITITLFEDESPKIWKEKLNAGYEMREDRLKFQNERMLTLMAEAEDKKKEAELALKEAGIKVTPIHQKG